MSFVQALPYVPKHKIRIVTAASLFDGHDAAINIMRRIIQATGAEVIHLGHDRSVEDVVNTAIQEDAHAIAPKQKGTPKDAFHLGYTDAATTFRLSHTTSFPVHSSVAPSPSFL